MNDLRWDTHGPRFLDTPRVNATNGLEPGTVVIYGVPYDGTASFRPGARFGPDALRAASLGLETWSPEQSRDMLDANMVDIGNLDIPFGAPEPVVRQVCAAVRGMLEAKLAPLMVGGEHTVSIGAIQAAAQHHPDLVVVQLDAHADLRPDYLGDRFNHACTMRRVLEHIEPERLLQVGIRSGTREEFHELQESNRLVTPRADALAEALARSSGPVYLTVDLDVFDPALLPGTGTPEPGGIDWSQFMTLLQAIPPARLVAADVVELAPQLDTSGVSAVLAAKVVREVALRLQQSRVQPRKDTDSASTTVDHRWLNKSPMIHWVHPAIEVRQTSGSGLGCYSTEDLASGTVVTVWGGNVMTSREMKEISRELQTHALQIDEDHFLVPTLPLEPTDYVNHSCNPSCGIRGQSTLVTRRDVKAGEAITFDYAMSDSTDYDQFDCACGADTCRGRITGDDWQRPELQERYRGLFSAYLQARID